MWFIGQYLPQCKLTYTTEYRLLYSSAILICHSVSFPSGKISQMDLCHFLPACSILSILSDFRLSSQPTHLRPHLHHIGQHDTLSTPHLSDENRASVRQSRVIVYGSRGGSEPAGSCYLPLT